MITLLTLILVALGIIICLIATPQDERGTVLTAICTTLVLLGVIEWAWPFVLVGGYYAIHSSAGVYLFGSPFEPKALLPLAVLAATGVFAYFNWRKR